MLELVGEREEDRVCARVKDRSWGLVWTGNRLRFEAVERVWIRFRVQVHTWGDALKGAVLGYIQ